MTKLPTTTLTEKSTSFAENLKKDELHGVHGVCFFQVWVSGIRLMIVHPYNIVNKERAPVYIKIKDTILD